MCIVVLMLYWRFWVVVDALLAALFGATLEFLTLSHRFASGVILPNYVIGLWFLLGVYGVYLLGLSLI